MALFIDVLTDNRNRTVGEIRHMLSKYNGSLGENGCVAWIFELKGSIVVPANGRTEDDMMELVVDSGADDYEAQGDFFQITSGPGDLHAVREALEAKGVEITEAELVRIPQNTVKLDGKHAEQMLKLMELLEDQDDVQRVSANFDIPDEFMQQADN